MSQESFKIFLVGDAGDHPVPGEVLLNLKKELNKTPNSAVVFLGDNSYKDLLWGIIPFGYKGFDSSKNTIAKVNAQLSLVDTYHGSVYFIPGNHDWWNKATYAQGLPKLKMEQSFIQENLKENTSIANPHQVFLPENGNLGPVVVELNNKKIRIVFIDTYRIILTGIRKNKINPEEKNFYDSLDRVIRQGYNLHQKVVIVAHHPVYSLGPYNRPVKYPYIFPRIKSSMGKFPSYQQMADRINPILRKYPGIFYASGHIHALQYFYTKDSIQYIISGAGSKEKMMSEKQINRYDAAPAPNEFLLWETGGFFEIDFNKRKTATYLYYNDGASKCSLPE